MRKKHLLLGVAVLYYSFLFYHQTAGINFLIFNVALIAIALYQENTIWKSNTWLASAFACLLTSASIAYHHTNLSIIANLISLVALMGFSRHRKVSLPTAIANAVVSFMTSHFLAISEKFNLQQAYQTIGGETKPIKNESNIFAKKAIKIGVPLIVTLLFLIIYMSANLAFNQFVSSLFSTNFISWSWVVFTFGGFMLLFPFFYPQIINELTDWDLASSDRLVRTRRNVKEATFRLLDLKNEYQTGWLMFAMLNGLLLFVNGLDVYYLWIVRQLPQGIVHADYVHQGVYALILSIVLAIAIILYFFRRSLNFYFDNQLLKNLAYAWIVQNIFLVITTTSKTMIYVNQFGLTHKRIGVFIYLTLTLIGLITTFIKIYKIRGNWFLFRKNAWAFYAVLLFATCFNWDRIITNQNLQNIHSQEIDFLYLVNLSSSNLPELVRYAATLPKNHQTMGYSSENIGQENQQDIVYNTKGLIQTKQDVFLEKYKKRLEENAWQSWNYDDYRICQAITDKK